MGRPVIVGIDGSVSSQAALAQAAWEAQRRKVALRLVHSYYVVVPYAAWGLTPDPQELDYAVAAARAMLADFESKARSAYPELEVQTELVAGPPGGALVEQSREAALVVVGSRGLGGFAGLMLGSVSEQLAAHSHAPVIVVRPVDEIGDLGAGPPHPHSPVVVGVDGVPESEAALGFAFDEAAARGVPLLVLYAWWMLSATGIDPIDLRHYDLATAEEEARRMLSEATAGWSQTYPDVAVKLLAAHAANPTLALLEVSQGAGLLVVSRHGGNALTRLLLGSVGDAALRKATCPVAVVPEHTD